MAKDTIYLVTDRENSLINSFVDLTYPSYSKKSKDSLRTNLRKAYYGIFSWSVPKDLYERFNSFLKGYGSPTIPLGRPAKDITFDQQKLLKAYLKTKVYSIEENRAVVKELRMFFNGQKEISNLIKDFQEFSEPYIKKGRSEKEVCDFQLDTSDKANRKSITQFLEDYRIDGTIKLLPSIKTQIADFVNDVFTGDYCIDSTRLNELSEYNKAIYETFKPIIDEYLNLYKVEKEQPTLQGIKKTLEHLRESVEQILRTIQYIQEQLD